MKQQGARVTAVMLDTVDLDAGVEFWSWFLDLEVVHRTDTYAHLSPMSAGGPHLALQRVAEPRPGKNRLHLDIRVDDRAAAEEAIVAAGGTRMGEVNEAGFPTWSVMADPLGNEFCIYEASSE